MSEGTIMWGIVPAAGAGTRIQPLAFSKELLPVGSRFDGGMERPRAASEYLVERMVLAGATNICFVISPGKWDILEYYGERIGDTHLSYVVQQDPCGLCDAIFKALPLIPRDESVLVGLPDRIWFPVDGFRSLSPAGLSFLLFPVDTPELFDAVLMDDAGRVLEIQVKQPGCESSWIWGAFRLDGATLKELFELWTRRNPRDEYIGTLVNAYLARGGTAAAVRSGSAYVDVGTFDGYRQAIELLRSFPETGSARAANRPSGCLRAPL